MLKLPKLTKNISGEKFWMLTAIEYIGSNNGAKWLFKCECGNNVKHNSSMVKGGHIRSCGCMSKKNQYSATPIFEGQKIGQITAIKMLGKKGHNISWECSCFCGNIFSALSSNIISGNTKSCGCLKAKICREKATIHGMSNTSVYGLWNNIMRRCYDAKNPAYKNYGGRGIKVCDRWHDFEKFFEDMGNRPEGFSIDRKNNDAEYSNENCQWSTATEQARNRRDNVFIEINGENKTIAEWSEITGVPYGRINQRRSAGWHDEDLFIPVGQKRRIVE